MTRVEMVLMLCIFLVVLLCLKTAPEPCPDTPAETQQFSDLMNGGFSDGNRWEVQDPNN